jgi:hypothetical protein
MRSFSRRYSPGRPASLPRQLLQFAPCIAEYHSMSRSGQDRTELAAHQAGTENAYSHTNPPRARPGEIEMQSARRRQVIDRATAWRSYARMHR